MAALEGASQLLDIAELAWWTISEWLEPRCPHRGQGRRDGGVASPLSEIEMRAAPGP